MVTGVGLFKEVEYGGGEDEGVDGAIAGLEHIYEYVPRSSY